MNTYELARDFAEAINAGDWDAVASFLLVSRRRSHRKVI